MEEGPSRRKSRTSRTSKTTELQELPNDYNSDGDDEPHYQPSGSDDEDDNGHDHRYVLFSTCPLLCLVFVLLRS